MIRLENRTKTDALFRLRVGDLRGRWVLSSKAKMSLEVPLTWPVQAFCRRSEARFASGVIEASAFENLVVRALPGVSSGFSLEAEPSWQADVQRQGLTLESAVGTPVVFQIGTRELGFCAALGLDRSYSVRRLDLEPLELEIAAGDRHLARVQLPGDDCSVRLQGRGSSLKAVVLRNPEI